MKKKASDRVAVMVVEEHGAVREAMALGRDERLILACWKSPMHTPPFFLA